MMIKIETTADFLHVINNTELAIIKFGSEWCKPCKILENILSKLSDFDIYTIDTEELQDVSAQYGVMSIPVILIFKHGEVVDRVLGLKSEEYLKNTFIEYA
jgi:thioredoxin 1